MIRAARLRLHEITMTLGAHFGPFELQKIFLIRSMGPMARIAAAIQNGLMGVCFQKLSFGIGMAGITSPVQSVSYNILDI
jgi:hypothetical protein